MIQPKITNEELLNVIIDYITTHNYSPTVRDLMNLTDIQSSSTMHYRIKQLRDNGFIDYVDNEPRTIRVIGYKYVKE